jgi:sulfide:quinone oxidoreductase
VKNLVILGAGTGGAIIANLMARKLPDDWDITVIDKSQFHLYQPGFLFLPFSLYGYKTRDDVSKPIKTPLPDRAKFVSAKVKLIDHKNKRVETTSGEYRYDWLVLAMGAKADAGEVDGLQGAMEKDVAQTFYTLDGALNIQKRLDTFNEGRLVVNIADMPIKCPVAPIEFVFLADYFFSEKGIRDKITIELVTPLTGAFTKPAATKVLSAIAEEKNIAIRPNFAIAEVDADTKTISSFGGEDINFDYLVSIPPNVGPEVIEDSGLGNGMGYAHTDPKTLKILKADQMYAIGDNTDVPTSKAGSVAHFEAEIVAVNLVREIEGKEPLPDFDGHANCFIESGYHQALLFDFNYDTEPLPGDFPLPKIGPFSLLKQSTLNHWGKLAFKQIYWNLLLTGHLPGDPFLPSNMSMTGTEPEKVAT